MALHCLSEKGLRNDQRGGGAERRESQTSTYRSEADGSRTIPETQPYNSLVVYRYPPQTIHVEAHNFKEVVQRLTGKEVNQNETVDEHLAAHRTPSSNSLHTSQKASENSTTSTQSSFTSSNLALVEWLDRLDSENPSPRPSANMGFFPTAGLVKGVNMELGLQWDPIPDSIGSASSRPFDSVSQDGDHGK